MGKYAKVSPDGLVVQVVEDDGVFVDISHHELKDQIQPEWTYDTKHKIFRAPVMKKYVQFIGEGPERIVSNVFEIPATRKLEESFPPELVKDMMELTDKTMNVKPGYTLGEEGQFNAPPPPKEPTPFEIAKRDFARKWPLHLQLQAMREAINHPEHHPLYDSFEADCDTLEGIAGGKPYVPMDPKDIA